MLQVSVDVLTWRRWLVARSAVQFLPDGVLRRCRIVEGPPDSSLHLPA